MGNVPIGKMQSIAGQGSKAVQGLLDCIHDSGPVVQLVGKLKVTTESRQRTGEWREVRVPEEPGATHLRRHQLEVLNICWCYWAVWARPFFMLLWQNGDGAAAFLGEEGRKAWDTKIISLNKPPNNSPFSMIEREFSQAAFRPVFRAPWWSSSPSSLFHFSVLLLPSSAWGKLVHPHLSHKRENREKRHVSFKRIIQEVHTNFCLHPSGHSVATWSWRSLRSVVFVWV